MLRVLNIWNAFMQLDRMRTFDGMSGQLTPINARDIGWYLWTHGITDVDVRIQYFALIAAMDHKRLSLQAEETERKRKKDGGTSTNDKR